MDQSYFGSVWRHANHIAKEETIKWGWISAKDQIRQPQIIIELAKLIPLNANVKKEALRLKDGIETKDNR